MQTEAEQHREAGEPTTLYHPRMFFDGQDVPSLQKKSTSTHAEIWASIKAYVDSQVGTTPPSDTPRDASLETYRTAGNQLIPFAFACALTEQQTYCDLTRDYLLTYATWQRWDNTNERGLGLAHLLMGNAIAYDWVYEKLTPAERETIRASLGNWARRMYEASSESNWDAWHNWWYRSYLQNYYWVCNSSLGVASLVLLGEDPRAQAWLDQASSKIARGREFLEGIADGTWHESIPYQDYMLTMTLQFLVNLRKIEGVDLFPHTYLQNYVQWRLYNYLPDTTQFIMAYGDFEWDWLGPMGHLFRFIAKEYHNGYAEWLAQRHNATYGRNPGVWSARQFVLEFLFYDPSIRPVAPTESQKTHVFTDLEGVIWRTGWGKNDLVFALKTGAPGGRFAFDTFTRATRPWEAPCDETDCQLNIDHDHFDTNSFYLYRAGQWLVPESEGVGKRGTPLHNTLLIDSQNQYMPPASHYGVETEDSRGSDGFLEVTASTAGFDYVAADSTRRYRHISGLSDVTRHVLFVRPNYFLMLDTIASTVPHQYEWISHSGAEMSLEDSWVRSDVGNEQMLGVAIVAPQAFKTKIGDDGKAYVRIQPATPAGNMRFVHLLYPTDRAGWQDRPKADLLDDNGQGMVVRVQSHANEEHTDDILITYGEGGTPIMVGPYQYDGTVAVVRRDVHDVLDGLFVLGGTFLRIDESDTALVTQSDRRNAFEVTYSDQRVVVQGMVYSEVTLLAPQAHHLIVNGVEQSFSRSGDYITFRM